MTRRHIQTFARYFRSGGSERPLPGRKTAGGVRPAAGKPRTGGRALHVQDRAGRPPAKKRARNKRTKIMIAEDRRDGLVVKSCSHRQGTTELLDDECRLPLPAGGERESGDGTAAQ